MYALHHLQDFEPTFASQQYALAKQHFMTGHGTKPC